MKTEEEVLTGMLDLFEDGKRWVQHALAKDRNGYRDSPLSENAVEFCLLGAAFRCAEYDPAAHNHYRPEIEQMPACLQGVLKRLVRTTGVPNRDGCRSLNDMDLSSLAIWNNSRDNYGLVKAALEAALEDRK